MQNNSHAKWLAVALLLLVALVVGFGFVFNRVQQALLTEEFAHDISGISRYFNDTLKQRQNSLGTVLVALENDPRLVDGLASGDRERLLQMTAPLFQHLRKEHAITHFYFTSPQRVNLLRVHQPRRYNDTINRKTTLIAESSGKMSSGLEMGPIGTLTLRVVSPWYQEGVLIGYVELGAEIEHLVNKLPALFGLQATVFLNKSMLHQGDWESGMHMLGREPDWMRHSEHVTAYSTQKSLAKLVPPAWGSPAITLNGDSYRIGMMPVIDVVDREVGQIAFLSRLDSNRIFEGRGITYTNELFMAMGGGVTLAILLVFYFARRILTTSKRELNQARQECADAFDAMADPVFLHDENMHLIHANQAYLKQAEMDQKSIMHRPYWEVFPILEGCLPCCADSVKDSLDGVESDDLIEDEFVLPDGRLFNSRTSLLRNKQGEYQYSIHLLQDVTEKRNAQEQLRLSSVAFDNTIEGIVITDAQSNILMVNRGFCEITGYTSQELLHKQPSMLQSGKHDISFYTDMWVSLEKNNRWQGEIWNRRKSGEVYPQLLTISSVHDAQGTITHYVGVFADLTDLKRSQDAINHLTHHDALTGLPNRCLLEEQLDHAIQHASRNNSKVALLILNPRRIKVINESLGHMVGDLLLTAIARRLKGALRQLDTLARTPDDMDRRDALARLTGNEFAIILEDAGEPKDVTRVANRILEAVARPFDIGEHRVVTSASIGISIYPADGENVESMIQCADTAAHRAKNERGSASCFFSADMAAIAAEALMLETELRRGLEQDEFVLHYQPQFSIDGATLTGVEALVRWNHPVHGHISPAKFIPVAEETGLIVRMGNQVLIKACRQAARWHHAGWSLPVAVNLSARQFQQSNLVADIKRALHESGLPAELLELEITETCVMESGEEAITILDHIKSIGVGLAMDDFGTGYSSLAYLKRFPIDKLKIDRAFVRDLPEDSNDAAIARAIISLADSMQLRVLAEGVETDEQLDFLKREGCHEMQGFLRGRPMPAGELEKLLTEL